MHLHSKISLVYFLASPPFQWNAFSELTAYEVIVFSALHVFRLFPSLPVCVLGCNTRILRHWGHYFLHIFDWA